MKEQQYETRKNVDEKILRSYPYGSRVYKTNNDKSDYDFIIVVESDKEFKYSVDFDKVNLSVYSEPLFLKLINEHHIYILECIFQGNHDKYLKYFELDTEKLRRAISSVSSNSFVKCKKKMKQGDIYIGKKSLFHSLRILSYGIQIAKFGRITNYQSANGFYRVIMGMDSEDWKDYEDKFKPVYNSLKSMFKRVAPLNSEKT